jgi:hypothetical protein
MGVVINRPPPPPVTPAGFARCTHCHERKPVAAFHRAKGNRSGYASWCKACFNAACEVRRKLKAARKALIAPYVPEGCTQCWKCQTVKRHADFYRNRASKTGHSNTCVLCQTEARREKGAKPRAVKSKPVVPPDHAASSPAVPVPVQVYDYVPPIDAGWFRRSRTSKTAETPSRNFLCDQPI